MDNARDNPRVHCEDEDEKSGSESESESGDMWNAESAGVSSIVAPVLLSLDDVEYASCSNLHFYGPCTYRQTAAYSTGMLTSFMHWIGVDFFKPVAYLVLSVPGE